MHLSCPSKQNNITKRQASREGKRRVLRRSPEKVKLESRVMGDYSARFREHNYDHSSSAKEKLDSIFERGRMKTCRSQSLWDYCT